MLRSPRSYRGIPVSTAAYSFLVLVRYQQDEIFKHLPRAPDSLPELIQAQASEWPADPKVRHGDDAFNRHVFVESARMAAFDLMPYRGGHNLALEDSPTWESPA